MKHLSVLAGTVLALLCPFLAPAQRLSAAQPTAAGPITPPSTTFYSCLEPLSGGQRRADSLLAPLDKAQIPTGILYDRVPAVARLTEFGQRYANPDTSNVNHFLQAYYELRAANYVDDGRPCRQLLSDNAEVRGQRDTLLLGVLRFRFNYLDPRAVQDNLLYRESTDSSRLHDVVGRSRSPYLPREVVVAAALAASTKNQSVRFRLDPASIFNNIGSTLNSATIDFGDGSGSRTCAPGQVLSIVYPSAGWKYLRYVLTYADGRQFTTYSELYVQAGGSACLNCRTANEEQPCRTVALTADIAHVANRGQAEVSYYYKTTLPNPCTATIASKPIILLDGFDYTDARKASNIFSQYLAYKNGIENLNFGDELRQSGYDVVIMNFPNLASPVRAFGSSFMSIYRRSGVDLMERNAYTLVKLIQDLNRAIRANTPVGTTPEKLVIVGPSMGGQISRFALAYMEKRFNDPNDAVAYQNVEWNHNTRLWIALDSPHNGANTPIGDQYFLKFFADQSQEASAVAGLAQVNSPASRQLSQQHVSQSFLVGSVTWQRQINVTPDPARTGFMSTLMSFGNGGYPANLRRVAVTNGSIIGQRQTSTLPGGLDKQGSAQAFVFEYAGGHPTPLSPNATVAKARVYFAPDYNNTSVVARCKYLTARGALIMNGSGGTCSRDVAPGGYFNVQAEISGERKAFSFTTTMPSLLTNGNNATGIFTKQRFYSVDSTACFIPMLSALGYTPSNPDYCTAINARNLVCEGNTPFDAYYGPLGANQPHIQLTPGNVEFMRKEIMKVTPTPVMAVSTTSLCPNGGPELFSVQTECLLNRTGQQPTTTYTWTLGPGLRFGTGSNGQGPSQQIQAQPGYQGSTTVTITATRGGSTPASIVLPIAVQPSNLDFIMTPTFGHIASRLTFTVTGHNTRGPYTWRRDGSSTNLGTFQAYEGSMTGRTIYFDTSVHPGIIRIQVSGTNTCNGAAISSGLAGYEITDPYAARTTQAAYPNPADGYFTVRLPVSTGAAPATTSSTVVTVYNNQGRAVRQERPLPRATELRFTTSDLPAGLYNVVIQSPGVPVERYHLTIEHTGN